MSRVSGRCVVRRPARLVLALAWLLAGCAASGPRPTPPVPAASGPAVSAPPRAATPVPVRTVLANGVVLIAQEHRASDVVALQLWFRVGGRDEAADELGLSHYLEHMLFKGTPTRPPGAIDREIEGLGGTSNAYTGYDNTHYDIVVPVARMPAALEILADIAVNASFVPAELESEKKVVFEEMNVLEDDPEKALVRRLYELGYAPHPYGRPILGTRDLIQALDRDRLARYYRKYYAPTRMALVVVGPVTPAAIRDAAEATFGRLAGAEDPRPSPTSLVPIDRSRRLDVRRAEEQAYLGLAWRGVPTGHEDIFAVDLLTYILGDSPSSRLNQTVRERERLVSSIEAGYGAWQLGGLVTVTARLDAPNLDRAEASILEVVRGVRANGVTEAERQRALITAESNYAFDIETAEGLAKSYGQAETTWTLDDELAYLSRLRQVTAAQIQAAARTYFGDDNYARVRFIPDGRPR